MNEKHKEDLRLMFAEIQNFKGIKHQVIEFDGRSAWLIGGNGAGKSSIIDAICSIAGSKYIPEVPIREGEQRGIINLKIGNPDNPEIYDISITFTPSMRTGRVKLKVNGTEVVKAPKEMIKSIFDRISFDIYEFLSSDNKSRINQIKAATGKETELNELDYKEQLERVEFNRLSKNLSEAKAVNGRDNRPFTDEDIARVSSGPIDESALMEEMSAVNEKIEKWNKNKSVADARVSAQNQLVSKLENVASQIIDIKDQIEALNNKLQSLEEVKVGIEQSIDVNAEGTEKAKQWLERNPSPPSTKEVADKISMAREHNRMHQIISEYRKRQDEILSMSKRVQESEDKIAKIKSERLEIIKSSQLPVDNFTWDDDGLYLNGIPLDQVNTASKLDLAVSLSMAINKKLKLVMIREGSLFDLPHLNKVLQRIADAGYMYIVEWVDPKGGDLEIKFEEKPMEVRNV